VFNRPLVVNSDHTVESGTAALASGVADAVSFGRPFISTPNLVDVLKRGDAWAAFNPKTWYSSGPEGYTDYPPL